MFKDYYAILEVSENASQKEIQDAYRRLSLKWHPDRNPGQDTGELMMDINEAYSILKDKTKRAKYDIEYSLFKSYKTQSNTSFNTENNYKSESRRTNRNSYTYEYDVKDEDLEKDIYEARKNAESFVKEFYANLKSDSKRAASGALKAMKPIFYLFAFTVGVLILSLIISAITSH